MKSYQFARSTGRLVSGIILTFIGQAVWNMGQQAALLDSLTRNGYVDNSNGAQGASVIGALLTLMGLSLLIAGVGRLSKNVDLAALVAARNLEVEEAASIEATQKRVGPAGE